MDITIDKLDAILKQLTGLRIKEAVTLKKRLEKEKEKLIPKIETEIPKEETRGLTNQKRSSKLSRYWRYVKLIRDNYPHLKTNQIRKQLTIRRQGKKTEISDAVWQNPSV
ncbi:MAG: hypothetical protein WD717_07235 [Nitrosarchaeum sp.]